MEFGLLESLLSALRGRQARRLIADESIDGWVADLGCGPNLRFVQSLHTRKRVGVDRRSPSRPTTERFVVSDIGFGAVLPLRDCSLDAVTLLAVLEHLPVSRVTDLIEDVYRVLRPGGVFVLTTPLPWTDRLLSLMARVRLVSAREISEHQRTYTLDELRSILGASRFAESVEVGRFEFGANAWAAARKEPA